MLLPSELMQDYLLLELEEGKEADPKESMKRREKQ
jgi:hypothetical protein